MKCDVSKCKASCCYNVPLSISYINSHRKKIVNPIIELVARSEVETKDDKVIPMTSRDASSNKCPFLRSDYRCNVYGSRPHLCKIFGEEKYEKLSDFLRCSYRHGEEPETLTVRDAIEGFNNTLLNKSSFV